MKEGLKNTNMVKFCVLTSNSARKWKEKLQLQLSLLQLSFVPLELDRNWDGSVLRCTQSCHRHPLAVVLCIWKTCGYNDIVCLSNIQLFPLPPCPVLLCGKVTFWNVCSSFDLSTERAIYGNGTWHWGADLRIWLMVPGTSM